MQLAAYDYVIWCKNGWPRQCNLSFMIAFALSSSCVQYQWQHYLQYWASGASSRHRPWDPKATWRDAKLGKVYRYVQDGWPSPEVIRPYRSRLTELTIEGRCVMWGIRVVIPKGLQSQVLKSLHANQLRISWRNAITHSHFWWEGLDRGIETLGKSSLLTCFLLQLIHTLKWSQVIMMTSNDFNNIWKDHRSFKIYVCPPWVASTAGIGQQAPIHFKWVFSVPERK